jgi:hypothetical protein
LPAINAETNIDRSAEHAKIWRTKAIVQILDALLVLDEEALKRWIRETWPQGIGLYNGKQ